MSPFATSAQAHGSTSSSTSVSETRKKLAILEKYELPSHWHPPSEAGPLGPIKVLVFSILCICAYGQPRLDFMWASIKLAEEGDETVWMEGRKRTSEQQNNILVLAGLLLATSSVFITTPPPDPAFLDYTRRGPYLCICGAFGLLIGAIIVTSICVVVTSKISPTYASKVLFRNTLHVYLTLIAISYPSVCTSAATLILAFGVLAGLWSAHDLGFQLGAVVILLLPVSIGLLFAVSSIRADTDRGVGRVDVCDVV